MIPVLCYLLLLWLTCWTAATEISRETTQVVQVTESQEVSLSCLLNHAQPSSDLDLIWLGPTREELLYVNVRYHRPEASLNTLWGLSIYRTFGQNTSWFTCKWNGISGKDHVLSNRTSNDRDDFENIQDKMKVYEKMDYEDFDGSFSGHQEDFLRSAMEAEYFPCDAPVHRNWTQGTLLWIQHDPPDQNIVLINMTIQRSLRYSLDMNSSLVSLILPSATFQDAGNYSRILPGVFIGIFKDSRNGQHSEPHLFRRYLCS